MAVTRCVLLTGRSSAIADSHRLFDSVGYEGLLIDVIEQVLMTEADIHVNQGNHSPKKLS